MRSLTIAAILLTVVTLWPHVARAEGKQSYPIWWSPELELDSLADIEARLDRPFWPEDTEGLPLVPPFGDGTDTVSANSCATLLRLTDVGYAGLGTNGIGVVSWLAARCRTIDMLQRAKPPQRSYLRSFTLDADAVNYLPALVNNSPSCEFICREHAANERRIPFPRMHEVESIEQHDDGGITVNQDWWETTLSILARADFTADGLDDLLLMSRTAATEGSMRGANLFLLSRTGPGDVLHVVDAERHLCPQYDCPARYDDADMLRVDEAASDDIRIIAPPEPVRLASRLLNSEPAPESRYPVIWSEALNLKSLDDVDDRLSRTFSPLSEYSIQLYKADREHLQATRAFTCADLERLTERGFYGAGRYDIWPQHYWLAECRVIALLRHARPARVSHLRDLLLTVDLVGLLPAATLHTPDCRWLNDDKTRRLSDTGEISSIHVYEDHRLDIVTPTHTVTMTFIAFGDVDGDSIDDGLLIARADGWESPWGGAGLYVLTRETPEGPLRILNGTRKFCPTQSSQHPGTRSRAEQREPAPKIVRKKTSLVTENRRSLPPIAAAPYPVAWSPALDLDAPDEIDSRLQKVIWPIDVVRFQLFKAGKSENGTATVQSCNDLMALSAKGFLARGTLFQELQRARLAQCEAIAHLQAARPPGQSFLREFVLTEKTTIDVLITAGLVRKCDANCAASPPSKSAVVQIPRKDIERIRAHAPGLAYALTELGKLAIDIAARADFNGDGLDDMLLLISSKPTYNAPNREHLCLLTREARDAPLRLLLTKSFRCLATASDRP